jgi:hypothetical protein
VVLSVTVNAGQHYCMSVISVVWLILAASGGDEKTSKHLSLGVVGADAYYGANLHLPQFKVRNPKKEVAKPKFTQTSFLIVILSLSAATSYQTEFY